MYRLLVVDDEPKIREVIKEYAEFNGYEVTEAEDGMSAVGLCKLNEYDLVIFSLQGNKEDPGCTYYHAFRKRRRIR